MRDLVGRRGERERNRARQHGLFLVVLVFGRVGVGNARDFIPRPQIQINTFIVKPCPEVVVAAVEASRVEAVLAQTIHPQWV